jgi:hypothetical protein
MLGSMPVWASSVCNAVLATLETSTVLQSLRGNTVQTDRAVGLAITARLATRLRDSLSDFSSTPPKGAAGRENSPAGLTSVWRGIRSRGLKSFGPRGSARWLCVFYVSCVIATRGVPLGEGRGPRYGWPLGARYWVPRRLASSRG